MSRMRHIGEWACAALAASAMQGCASPLVQAFGHGEVVRQATQAQRLPRAAPNWDGRTEARELDGALANHMRGIDAPVRPEAAPAAKAAP